MAKTGAELIAEERRAQYSREDYSGESDDDYVNGELASAAICYAAPCKIFRSYSSFGDNSINFADPWPWTSDCDKREKHSLVRRLVIAGALIAAEIDRLNRAEVGE